MSDKTIMIFKIGASALSLVATSMLAIVEYKCPDKLIDKVVEAVKAIKK